MDGIESQIDMSDLLPDDQELTARRIADDVKRRVFDWAKWIGGVGVVLLTAAGVRGWSDYQDTLKDVREGMDKKIEEAVNLEVGKVTRNYEMFTRQFVDAVVETKAQSKAMKQDLASLQNEIERLQKEVSIFESQLVAYERSATKTYNTYMASFKDKKTFVKMDEPKFKTPDFTAQQAYLSPAPDGINARHAWTVRGGKGDFTQIGYVGGGVGVHEDLPRSINLVAGGEASDTGWLNFGAAAVGMISAMENDFGMTGIAPNTNVSTVGIFDGVGSALAIKQAADTLRSGDIILVGLQRSAHAAGKMIPIEWWPDDLAAIRYAVDKGVIVVSPAGNGGMNLNDPVFDSPQSGFPEDWANPFRRVEMDSGSILVGAGAPPPGKNGDGHGPSRSRLGFSNYGSAVDVQGWGHDVATLGYGDLQGGSDRTRFYTARFSAGGSAAAMVAGTLASIQGVLRARGLDPLGPEEARNLLRTVGSPQQDAPERPKTQRIGPLPDLRSLIPAALALRKEQ